MVGDPFTAVVLDVERHVAESGWDQPTRIYGVVSTTDLLAQEPQLAEDLGLSEDGSPLTPLDQGELPWHGSLEDSLARLAWPEVVLGAVLVTERVVAGEDTSPQRLMTAATGDGTDDLRLVVGVLRDGRRMCAVRFRSSDDETAVLTGPDIAPGLSQQLAATLSE
jgi:hypothetical protein